MHVIYTGERVRLRPFADAKEFNDLDDMIMETANDFWGPFWLPRVGREAGFDSVGMLDPSEYSLFAVERCDSGELIGIEEHGGMPLGSIQTWLGTYVLKDHWHLGYGIEAKQLMLCYLFENYPLDVVRADTVGNHVRAHRGLEAAGLRHKEWIRGAHVVEQRRLDIARYAIFREEWELLPIRDIVQRG